jgi:integrase
MAQRNTFSPKAIEALMTGRLPDPQTAGLFVEVHTARGEPSRVWKYRRRVSGGASREARKATLGPFPTYSIADARAWAAALNECAERGIDPAEKLRERRAAGVTVAEAHGLYMKAVRSGERRGLKPRTILGKEQIWSCDVKRQIGDRTLQEITDEDLWSLVLTKGQTAPVRANRLAAELKVFLKWCASRAGKQAGVLLPSNPAISLEGNYFRSRVRSRHLSHEELGWLLQALAREERLYQRAVLLLLLTGCRKEEVLGAPSAEVTKDVWSIPAERTKNSQIHRIPLSPWARSLAETDHRWLIPSSKKDGPMLAGWYKVLARITRAMTEIAGRPIPHFTYHDLRRTLRSNTKRLKIDFETAEAMLNHKKKGLEEVYDGYDLFDEKREGFARWEAFLVKLALKDDVAEALSIPDDARPSSDG